MRSVMRCARPLLRQQRVYALPLEKRRPRRLRVSNRAPTAIRCYAVIAAP